MSFEGSRGIPQGAPCSSMRAWWVPYREMEFLRREFVFNATWTALPLGHPAGWRGCSTDTTLGVIRPATPQPGWAATGPGRAAAGADLRTV